MTSTQQTSTTTTNRSAKEFQGPLMSVLYSITNGTAGAAVPFKDTYEPVMALMGIVSLDAYGTNSDGKEKVAQWIQWAFKNLKRTGQTEDAGRGKWALTAAGVTEAKTMTTTATAIAATPTTVPTVVPSTDDGVSSPVSSGHGIGTYHSDAYIRTLGAEATACFGNYSNKSDTCQRCTLQGPCINFLAAELSRLASVLKREDEAAVAAKVAEEARKAAAAAAAAAPRPAVPAAAPAAAADAAAAPAGNFDWTVWQTDQARDLIAKAQSECPRCRKMVEKGTKAVWLRATSAVGGRKKAVLFHKGCGPA